jgi:predicted TPR repeat methyltransferase
MNVVKKFAQAEDHFFKGQYQEAASLCQSIVQTKPDFAKAYYLLGALFKTTGQLEQAIKFCEMAIERDPKDFLFYTQKGHILLSMGQAEAAEAALNVSLQLNAQQYLPLLLLANMSMKARQFDVAMEHLKRAASLSNSFEVDEYMGLCFQMQGKLIEAETCFRTLLKKAPALTRGQLHLAKILFDLKQREESEVLFRQVLAQDPNAYDALIAIARLEDVRGNHAAAVELAGRAVQINAKNPMGFILYGGALISTGQFARALSVYEEALKTWPDNIHMIEGYAKVLMQLGQLEEAKSYILKVLEKKPDDKNMQYFLAAISGAPTESAPRAYVAGLFDEYADRFDEHLQQHLRYNTPKEISEALRAVYAAQNIQPQAFTLLDLGCGTGLGAEVLLDITSERVGVDLSSKMIEKAIEKQIYTETSVQDIVEYMEQSAQLFDLVICVDTLVYIGNLEPFFSAAKKVLKPYGMLAVSAEQGDDAPPYTIRKSARFGHAKSYLEDQAELHGFTIRHMMLTDLRKDKSEVIRGYIVVLQKAEIV